jgi:hypothetical protein
MSDFPERVSLEIGQPATDSCSSDTADETHAIIVAARRPRTDERYDLQQLFLAWAWFARFRDGADGWDGAVGALARTLRGLEGAGLIERRTIRRPGRRTHHGFTITDLGAEALKALSGEWIEEGR